jgi:triosephosphate isomerase (TIM)
LRKKICAGNWKMYKTPAEAVEFFIPLLASLTKEPKSPNAEVLFFPPALACESVAKSLKGSRIQWGIQNSYFEGKGAFTGENSAETAKAMGATYILIGHSERRKIFNETDGLIAKKVAHVQSIGLCPMLCVGEDLQERESGKTKEVILRQLDQGLASADAKKSLVIAYEPVWAIGTGKVATPEQAEEAHAILRDRLGSAGEQTPILYGGSVKPDNADELAKKKNIDGFLIGGASLEVKSFLGILAAL